MSNTFGEKFKLIRNELNLSQDKFARLVDIPVSTYKKNEGGFSDVGSATLQKVANTEQCAQYALWLLTDKTNIDAGQIAPGDDLPELTAQKELLAQTDFDENFVKTVADSLLMFCHLDWFVPNTDKVDFDDCGKIILKDVRSLIESRYLASTNVTHIKSA
jgi:transcriptional regulator with XRE-family HTH domain